MGQVVELGSRVVEWVKPDSGKELHMYWFVCCNFSVVCTIARSGGIDNGRREAGLITLWIERKWKVYIFVLNYTVYVMKRNYFNLQIKKLLL